MASEKCEDIKCSLMLAIKNREILKALDLIKSWLSYLPDWSDVHLVLIELVKFDSVLVAGPILTRDVGVKIDYQDKDDQTILHYAVKSGSLCILRLILNRCPDINNQSNKSSLKIAVFNYESYSYHGVLWKNIVEALLEYGLTVGPEDVNDTKLLHAAVKLGLVKIVEDLLKYGADVNAFQNLYDKVTPLHNAAKNKQEEVAKLLISYGADINAQDVAKKTPIFYTTENGDFKTAKLLITNTVNVKNNPELLRNAIIKGHKEVVELFLEYGADVDFKTRDMTPLHLCASAGHKEIIETILKFGADIDSRDTEGRTPLHIACKSGHVDVVGLLLSYGSNINITTKSNKNSRIISNFTSLDYAMGMLSRKRRDFYDEYDSDENSADDEHNEQMSANYRFYGRSSYLDSDHDYDHRNDAGYYHERTNRRNASRNVIDKFDLMVEVLTRRIIKMKAAKLHVSERIDCRNLDSERPWEIEYFQKECTKEIALMKSEKINANISFYDILRKGINSLEIFMKNKNVVQVLQSGDYETKFPIYASMIKNKFRKCMERKKLFEVRKIILYLLFKNYPHLPEFCVEKILSFLDEKDLKTLMILQLPSFYVTCPIIKEHNDFFFS